jgi:hypothetical protein
MKEKEDDGTLAFLDIDISNETRYFNCDVITQQKIINTSFYIIDFIEDVKTKHGVGRMVVKIKMNLEDNDSESKKFFTNSNDIKLVLTKVKEMGKLPRKVKMCVRGNNYFLE